MSVIVDDSNSLINANYTFLFIAKNPSIISNTLLDDCETL